MKKLKYIIILLIIIIFILLLILLKFNTKSNKSYDVGSIHEGKNEIVDMKPSIQFSDYSIIKECIQKYIDLLDKNNSIYYEKQEDGTDKYMESTQKETIYSVLNESFIKENNIDKNNVLEKISVVQKKQRFYPIKSEILNASEIKVYKVYGIIQDLEYIGRSERYYILFADSNENTFSVRPITDTMYNSYAFNEEIDIIKKQEYNTYSLQEVQTPMEYFEMYKFLTLANPKYTYDKMTEQYRSKRFGSLENYVEYVKNNYNEFKNMIPKKYLTNYKGEYTQYVIQDQNQNYYIFDALDALNYNVSLDIYTIDTEKFKTTYENSNSQQKVQMNIDKFFQMINRQDYRTSYNVLDYEFKAKKMKSQLEFENIAKNKLFRYNKISFLDYKDLGSNTYVYNIKLTDLTENKNGEINMTIVMKLKEETDFVMSFSFK